MSARSPTKPLRSPSKPSAALAHLRAAQQDYQLECDARLRTLRLTKQAHLAAFSRLHRSAVASLPPAVASLDLATLVATYQLDLAAAERGLAELALKQSAPPPHPASVLRKGKKRVADPAVPLSPSREPFSASKRPRALLLSDHDDSWDILSVPSPSSAATSNPSRPARAARSVLASATKPKPPASSTAARTTTTTKRDPTPSSTPLRRSARHSSAPPSTVAGAATPALFSDKTAFTYLPPADAPSYDALLEAVRKQDEEKARMADRMRAFLRDTHMSAAERKRLEDVLGGEIAAL